MTENAHEHHAEQGYDSLAGRMREQDARITLLESLLREAVNEIRIGGVSDLVRRIDMALAQRQNL